MHTTTRNVYVVELCDSVGPRRTPDLPNLHVGVTESPVHETIELLLEGRAGSAWVRNKVVAARPDLLEQFTPRQTKQEVAQCLMAQGFTVNRNDRTWRTYVIELDPLGLASTALAGAPTGWVYVGETTQRVEERWEQHRTGHRVGRQRLHNPKAHEFGRGLHPELMELCRDTYFCEAQAKKAEAALAKELRGRGYIVEGGH